MHICFLTGEYPLGINSHGGIGTFTKFLAEQLSNHKINVSVIGIYDKDEYLILNGVKIFKLKKSNWKVAKFYHHNLKLQLKLKEIHKDNPIDIVEGSELNFAFFAKKTPFKKVIRLHGGHHFFASEEHRKTNFWKSYQEKKSFKIADNYIAVTNYVGEKTKQLLNYNFDFKTIYNSIDFTPFYEADLKKEQPFKLVFVGTVCEKKGIKSLVLAMPKLLDVFPRLTLEIVGRDWIYKNRSYTAYLKSIIPDSIKDRIRFLGGLSYNLLPEVLEKAHICVYPSLAESFGLTLIEGMLMGKLVAASNIEPFKEITKKSSDIKLFEANSSEDIVKKVSELLTKEDVEIRKRNRKLVLSKFSPSIIINENIEFYKSLVKN